jgi:hypothetical protein
MAAISELTPEFEVVADQLISRTAGSFDPGLVRRLVAETAAQFDNARVRDYVEVIVMKEVGDELRRIRRSAMASSTGSA